MWRISGIELRPHLGRKQEAGVVLASRDLGRDA